MPARGLTGCEETPRDKTEFCSRFSTKKAAMGEMSRPAIGGITPRKRLRYTSDTVKMGRSSSIPCACGTHESKIRKVMMPPYKLRKLRLPSMRRASAAESPGMASARLPAERALCSRWSAIGLMAWTWAEAIAGIEPTTPKCADATAGSRASS
eukprot:scaffold150489_cov30-Tisochrysis_lutea.AAC.1